MSERPFLCVSDALGLEKRKRERKKEREREKEKENLYCVLVKMVLLSSQVCATVNLADGNTSPYEYNDNSPEIAWLDKRFSSLLKENVSDVDAMYTTINKLSKDYEDTRFSPFYNLMTESMVLSKTKPSWRSFLTVWNRNNKALLSADINLEALRVVKAKLSKPSELKPIYAALAKFDYVMMLALRDLQTYTYKGKKKFARITPRQFIESSASLRQGKQKMICEFLKRNNVTAMMVQEAKGPTSVWNNILAPYGYKIIMNSSENTGCIVPISFVGEVVPMPESDTKLHEESLIIVDTQTSIIYMSIHFNSKDAKKAGTPKNYENQWEFLCNFLKQLPSGVKYIIGADANHHPETTTRGMKMFPYTGDVSTTRKQRTSMQAQGHKVGKLDEGCKDHIITNFAKLKNGHVTMLTEGGDISKFLPNSNHPCDHFISIVEL
jgi:hypothetical protein